MRRFKNHLIAALVLGLLAIAGMGPKHAIAQQKTIETPQLVRNVDEPGFNPFQLTASMFVSGYTGSVSLPIPSGKVAVIEFVSAGGSLPAGGLASAFVNCGHGANRAGHTLPLTAQGSLNGSNRWVISQPVKCYATTQTSADVGGLTVGVSTTTFTGSSSYTWVVTVSGYLVPE